MCFYPFSDQNTFSVLSSFLGARDTQKTRHKGIIHGRTKASVWNARYYRFRRGGLPGSLIPGILSFTTWAIIRLQKEHSIRASTVGQPPYFQILHLKGDLWPSSSKTTWGRKEEARGGKMKGSLVLGSILAIH